MFYAALGEEAILRSSWPIWSGLHPAVKSFSRANFGVIIAWYYLMKKIKREIGEYLKESKKRLNCSKMTVVEQNFKSMNPFFWK